MNVQTRIPGLIAWLPDDTDESTEIGWVGGLRAFRLRRFGEEGLRNFRHRGFTGYVDALLIMKDKTCLAPVNSEQPGSHFAYFTDADDARAKCQRAIDGLASNFVASAR